MDPLIRVQDVARRLSVRPSTVYALAQRGLIPHVKLTTGRRRPLIRFRRDALEAWLNERTVPVEVTPDKGLITHWTL